METRKYLGAQRSNCRFKSYYVVWKLSVVVRAGTALARFKSYYVVWKPEYDPASLTFFFCLNRTM